MPGKKAAAFIDGTVVFRGVFEHPSFEPVEFFYKPIMGKDLVLARKDGITSERSLEANHRLINRHVVKWDARTPDGTGVNPKSESEVECLSIHVINGVCEFMLAAGNEPAATDGAAKNS